MITYVSTLGSKLSLVSMCVTADLCHSMEYEHLPDEPRLKDPRQVEKPQGGRRDCSGTVFYTHSHIH